MLCFDPYTTGCQLSFRLLAKQWLDPKFAPNEATVAAVLAPYPSELMEAHDVDTDIPILHEGHEEISPLLNKPEYDRADCINPVVERQFRLV